MDNFFEKRQVLLTLIFFFASVSWWFILEQIYFNDEVLPMRKDAVKSNVAEQLIRGNYHDYPNEWDKRSWETNASF